MGESSYELYSRAVQQSLCEILWYWRTYSLYSFKELQAWKRSVQLVIRILQHYVREGGLTYKNKYQVQVSINVPYARTYNQPETLTVFHEQKHNSGAAQQQRFVFSRHATERPLGGFEVQGST